MALLELPYTIRFDGTCPTGENSTFDSATIRAHFEGVSRAFADVWPVIHVNTRRDAVDVPLWRTLAQVEDQRTVECMIKATEGGIDMVASVVERDSNGEETSTTIGMTEP